MKITITIPEGVYAALEAARGRVPRSTYIQDLIMGGEQGNLPKVGTIPSPKKEEIKTDIGVEKLVKKGLVKKGVKELPSQDTGGFKTYFK